MYAWPSSSAVARAMPTAMPPTVTSNSWIDQSNVGVVRSAVTGGTSSSTNCERSDGQSSSTDCGADWTAMSAGSSGVPLRAWTPLPSGSQPSGTSVTRPLSVSSTRTSVTPPLAPEALGATLACGPGVAAGNAVGASP
jgi:hypothetical protein